MAGDTGESLELVSGQWWRFDRYEIADGCVRPAAGAGHHVYNPFEVVDSSRARASERLPYSSLLDVLKRLNWQRNPETRKNELTTESQALIVKWCEQYGLLGILLHQTIVASFGVRWASPEEFGLEGYGSNPVFASTRHVRTNSGWQSAEHFSMTDAAFDQDLIQGVISQPIDSSELRVEDLEVAWGEFFPELGPNDQGVFDYPAPGSEEFWRAYAEPVSAFVDGAAALEKALRALKTDQDVGTMHALISPVQLAFTLGSDGFLEQQWVCHSLLSALSLMACLDLQRMKVYLCATCRRPFNARQTKEDDVRYCSPRCRATARKRRQRGTG